jgi:hypothetical protein
MYPDVGVRIFFRDMRHLPSSIHHFRQNFPEKPDLDPSSCRVPVLLPTQQKSGPNPHRIYNKTSENRLIELEMMCIFKSLIRTLLFITMMENFCWTTARGIRQLGYTPKCATRYAGFFFVSMLSVWSAAGVLNVPSEAVDVWISGSGKSTAGARAGFVEGEHSLNSPRIA